MSQNENKLGTYLRSLREAGGLTLRGVEDKTGVSNALLSQLESGKVRRPSPVTLYKLAEIYRVPYAVLMEKAGYPVPEAAETARLEGGVFSRLGQLTAEEEESLLEYLGFLRSRGSKRRGRK